MPIRFATVCSGIEVPSLAWAPLGMQPVFYSEIDPFANRFLRLRHPLTPNLGDMNKIDGDHWRGKVDVLWGSTPCQSLSEAGKRGGVVDPRGALMLGLVGLANQIMPKVLCWENVEGALTHKENPFGLFLASLSGSDEILVPPGKRWTNSGYVLGPERNVAWRLLDAQYAGLPQHRRRVFVVACPRDGPDPRKILFEAGTTANFDPKRARREEDALVGADRSAFGLAIRGRVGGQQIEQGDTLAHCLRASTGGSDKPMVLARTNGVWRARLMTPVEAERCMGMPDNYTAPTATESDSDRYFAIGNSLPVPIVKWIGEQIVRILN
jgi:DNA (cytosine-5)-methyltransferase 1